MGLKLRKKDKDGFSDFEHRSNSNVRIENEGDADFDKLIMREDRKNAAKKAGQDAAEAGKEGARGFVDAVKNLIGEPVFIIAAILFVFIILFMRAYLVPSGSMRPTLMEGDRVLSLARYFPNGHTYERGDVVCFTAPDGTTYVKRVIGVGGDHVQISGEKVYVNGEESEWQGTGGMLTSMDVHLADDEYWVMGDNRANSQDSRFIGAIRADKMISRVYCIYYPFDRAKFL